MLARYLDSVALMMYNAWADVILKTSRRGSRNYDQDEALSHEAKQFFFDVALPIFQSRLSEFSQPVAFCGNKIVDADQNPFSLQAGQTLWQEQISTASNEQRNK